MSLDAAQVALRPACQQVAAASGHDSERLATSMLMKLHACRRSSFHTTLCGWVVAIAREIGKIGTVAQSVLTLLMHLVARLLATATCRDSPRECDRRRDARHPMWSADDEHCPSVVTGVAMSRRWRQPWRPRPTTTACACGMRRPASLADALDGHSDWVHPVALSPDGTTLASGGERSHGLSVGRQRQASDARSRPRWRAVAGVSFHPNGQQLAVVGFSNKLQIINTSTGQKTQELDCPWSICGRSPFRRTASGWRWPAATDRFAFGT